MRVLVVGSGGREHALAWKLAQEAEVFAAPGNPGIAQVAECFPIAALEVMGIVDLARKLTVDLVVVGPEDPLIAGLADTLREAGIAAYGPGAQAARLEASKAFSKELMRESGVPTAAFETFRDSVRAKAFASERFENGRAVVVKASGAALGKGVVVCGSVEDAHAAIEAMLVSREFGDAGEEIVVEERLSGREFSLLTVCSDHGIRSLPVAQDYKRAFDGDLGPNTGGMGSHSPLVWVSEDLVRETEERVVKPVLEALAKRGIAYRGTLFSGIMLDGDTPNCLEYNVRFGDPETQTVVRRLGAGFADLLLAAAKGEPLPSVETFPNAACTVVLASGGYPGAYAKGKPISLPSTPDGAVVFHAGTALEDGRLVTHGGRVLGVSATGETPEKARRLAYFVANSVNFEGIQYRNDIGT